MKNIMLIPVAMKNIMLIPVAMKNIMFIATFLVLHRNCILQ
jgi:hypothetical protein